MEGILDRDGKEKLVELKVGLVDLLVDRSFRLSLGSGFAGYLSAGLNEEKREVVKANWLVLNGQVDVGANILSSVIERNPYNRSAIVSLGSLFSQAGLKEYQFAWEKIRKQFFLINKPEKINKLNFPLFSLGIDLALRCEPELGESAIRNLYFPFIWRFQRFNKRDIDPIFYWHIPKTAGTSFNTHFSTVFYQDGTSYLPSYTNKEFFRTVLRLQNGVLPYLSSAHLSLRDFDGGDISSYRKVLVLRDPVSRALSAWRQYYESPISRLNILPQHGFIWDFLPSKNLTEWINTAPSDVLNVLNWTLSGDLKSVDNFVDDVVGIENLDCFGSDLVRKIGGLVEADNFAVPKNKTNKDKLKFQANDVEKDLLKKRLDLDYIFFNKLK